MAKAKVLSIDVTASNVISLKAANRLLRGALQVTADIVEEEIGIIISSCCAPDGKGHYDISTLDPKAKPDFERYTQALVGARKAIKKAGTI
jgi:hypothetical protein